MLTRGRSVFTPVFSSRLAPIFSRYVDLKRALGRRFDLPCRTLQSLDRFLHDQSAKYSDLNAAAFQAWCHIYEHVSSGVRRVRMLNVCSFCLYRRRTEPQCFVPDRSSFPTYHQPIRPYIFSEAEVAKLLDAASGLERYPSSPVRPEVIRLAIALLFTTGIRRGELLALRLGDYTQQESTLHIRALLLQKCNIVTSRGKFPRIHDARHSFAVNALLRWYRADADVEAKLPLLATYLGHGSPVSTHYYLHFIEPLRTAASERFANHYGELVSPLFQSPRRCQ
jgi:integrase/recombinase XerD